jgi:8-oxo-dGTP diphosphatase
MKSHTYRYPRPALTVDGVVFGLAEDGLKLLLIERSANPFKGCWALPGGFVDNMKESVDDAVRRELEEETNIIGLFLEQLYTFGQPGRDPRERVVSVAYFALVKPNDLDVRAGSDAKKVKWFDVNSLPDLAFDHSTIVRTGLERLRSKICYQPVGFELLPKQFTLSQLQTMYENILGRELDKLNFRKKILAMKIVNPSNEYSRTGGPKAKLYYFDLNSYKRRIKKGFNFEI